MPLAANEQVAGQAFKVAVTLNPGFGPVSRFNAYVDGVVVAETGVFTYDPAVGGTFEVNFTPLAVGTYSLTVGAWHATGGETVSDPFVVSVVPNPPAKPVIVGLVR